MRSLDLTEWLDGERQARGWSLRELGRRAGVSHAQVSHVLSGSAIPGWDFCVGMARALGLPPEDVMRRAGLLPSLPVETAEGRQVLEIVNRQAPAVRRVLLSMLMGLAGRPAPTDPALAEIAAIYEGLPEEWRPQVLEAVRHAQQNAQAGRPHIIGESDDPPDPE